MLIGGPVLAGDTGAAAAAAGRTGPGPRTSRASRSAISQSVARVHAEADVTAANLDVLVQRGFRLDARLPGHDAVRRE